MKIISILLGIVSLLCSVCILIALVAVMLMPLFVNPDDEIPVEQRPLVVAAIISLFLAVIGIFAFMIVEVVHVTRNRAIADSARTGWICAIVCLNVFVIPIYWFKHVRLFHRTSVSRRSSKRGRFSNR